MGKPRITQAHVFRVQASFVRSPRKSIWRASKELNMPKSTVHDVVHKRLLLRCYKLQFLHAIQGGPTPWPPRSPDMTPLDFFVGDLSRIECIKHLWQIYEVIALEMLPRVWQQIEYVLDITHATNGAHIDIH